MLNTKTASTDGAFRIPRFSCDSGGIFAGLFREDESGGSPMCAVSVLHIWI